MSDHREEAEDLAEALDLGISNCCPEPPRCIACSALLGVIESALEQAEAEGWRKGVEAAARYVEGFDLPGLRDLAICIRARVPPTEEE